MLDVPASCGEALAADATKTGQQMMHFPPGYSKILVEHGVPLIDAFGTEDVAFFRDDALVAASTLRGTGLAVLGGDVFYKTAQGFEIAYANWHCEPAAEEDADAFVDRSIQEACDYIAAYPSVPDKRPLFALVISQVFS